MWVRRGSDSTSKLGWRMSLANWRSWWKRVKINTGKEKKNMSVKVYGCNHIAIEVDDVEKAVAFYQDVFNLERLREGEGNAFFKLGEHQFLAMFEVKEIKP